MEIHRQQLVDVLEIAAHGLSKLAIVPSFQDFQFSEDSVVSFNGVYKIVVRQSTGIVGSVKGVQLLGWLKSLNSEMISIDSRDKEIRIKAESSKLSLARGEVSTLGSMLPSIEDGPDEVTDVVLSTKFIDLCSVALVTALDDPGLGGRSGVLLGLSSDEIAITSTDRKAFTRVKCGLTPRKKQAGEASGKRKAGKTRSVSLSADLLSQIVRIGQRFAGGTNRLLIGKDVAVAQFGCEDGSDGAVTVTGSCMEADSDIVTSNDTLIKKCVDERSVMIEVGVEVLKIFVDRQFLMAQEGDAVTHIVASENKLKLTTVTGLGDSEDSMSVDIAFPKGSSIEAAVDMSRLRVALSIPGLSQIGFSTDGKEKEIQAVVFDGPEVVHLLAPFS